MRDTLALFHGRIWQRPENTSRFIVWKTCCAPNRPSRSRRRDRFRNHEYDIAVGRFNLMPVVKQLSAGEGSAMMMIGIKHARERPAMTAVVLAE